MVSYSSRAVVEPSSASLKSVRYWKLDRLVDIARVVVAGGVLMPGDHVIGVEGLDRPQRGDPLSAGFPGRLG
jgi:hypothetical protein